MIKTTRFFLPFTRENPQFRYLQRLLGFSTPQLTASGLDFSIQPVKDPNTGISSSIAKPSICDCLRWKGDGRSNCSQPETRSHQLANREFLVSKDKVFQLQFPQQHGYSGTASCPFSSPAHAHAGNKAPGAVMHELKLAQTGEGIAECELIKWFVKEGDQVEEFQPVCEVQSDKATIEITSRYKGTVSRVHFMPGNMVKVGETLMDLLPAGAIPDPAPQPPPPRPTSPEEPIQSQAAVSPVPGGAQDKGPAGTVLSTPAVRHLARGFGINLADVKGTGKDGRVMKEDVMAYVAAREGLEEDMRSMIQHQTPEPGIIATDTQPTAPGVSSEAIGSHGVSSASVPPTSLSVAGGAMQKASSRLEGSGSGRRAAAEDTKIPIRGYRRAMAKTMAAAVTVPHFLYCDDVDMGALLQVRSSLEQLSGPAKPAPKLTYLPFLVKALSVALERFPILNSTVNSDVTEIHCKGSHNIGIAMATPSGLVVPNIKNCQERSILEIAKELQRLQSLSLANQLSPADIQGGSITISNIGSIGGTYASPILNLPEVAIVAVGRARRVPRVVVRRSQENGELGVATVMNVSWAADHRVIDGAMLATFCSEWKSLLEHPERLLLMLK